MDEYYKWTFSLKCSLNIGSPIAYYGLRMLDDIIFLGNPEKMELLI